MKVEMIGAGAADGVLEAFEPDLSPTDAEALERSARTSKSAAL